ncbi:MAG: copper transporter [Actinomycetota bacterium]|nr:copper transporter [Actinomycetota bacterium]
MINLRYHIVSIVAVFLALGIGLALGSTFVDSVLVSELEDQVDQLEADTLAAVAERDAAVDLADDVVSQRDELEQLATPLLSEGRLAGTSVVILAPDTVDRAEVDRLREVVVASDTDFGGVLWLTNSFDLGDGATRAALARGFDLAGDSQDAVSRAINFLMTQALFDPETAGDSTSENPIALTVLRDDGLLVYDPSFGGGALSEIGREGLVLLVVTDETARQLNNEVIFPLLAEVIDSGNGGSAVVIELDSGAGYGDVLEQFRAEPTLSANFSSVDGVDDFEGVLAMVSALDRLPSVGHYGRLSSAQTRLPG